MNYVELLDKKKTIVGWNSINWKHEKFGSWLGQLLLNKVQLI